MTLSASATHAIRPNISPLAPVAPSSAEPERACRAIVRRSRGQNGRGDRLPGTVTRPPRSRRAPDTGVRPRQKCRPAMPTRDRDEANGQVPACPQKCRRLRRLTTAFAQLWRATALPACATARKLVAIDSSETRGVRGSTAVWFSFSCARSCASAGKGVRVRRRRSPGEPEAIRHRTVNSSGNNGHG